MAFLSRLDRIYVRAGIMRHARDWRIIESGISTDHRMATVQLVMEHAPKQGRGRPIFPLYAVGSSSGLVHHTRAVRYGRSVERR